MIKTSGQSPSSIVMIRPHHFTVNAETAIDNAFQVRKIPKKELGNSAYQETVSYTHLTLPTIYSV